MTTPAKPNQAERRKKLEKELKEKLVELRAMFRKGQASMADALMVMDEEVEAIYAVGVRLLQQQKYKEAAKVLSNLCMLEAYDARYWRALGLALIKIERVNLAFAALEMAIIIEPHDIPALTYRGEQYILSGNKAKAREDLEVVIKVGKASVAEQKPFIERAKSLLKYAQTQH